MWSRTLTAATITLLFSMEAIEMSPGALANSAGTSHPGVSPGTSLFSCLPILEGHNMGTLKAFIPSARKCQSLPCFQSESPESKKT